jgi:hypothetical protein
MIIVVLIKQYKTAPMKQQDQLASELRFYDLYSIQ